MTRILVTGSRTWKSKWLLEQMIDFELDKLGEEGGVTIVHGGAHGADSIAGAIARERGYTEEVHPADWETHGKKAGFLRNTEMIKLGADCVIAAIVDNSRGATMTLEMAKKLNMRWRSTEQSQAEHDSFVKAHEGVN